jgi:NADH-quinone oxidoreductase subunit J
METFLFWLFATGAVLSAFFVVFPPFPNARAPIHSAISMVVCFFFVAAIYAMLSAHLLAILQVLVYAGAIMVLFIFVIMLLNIEQDEKEEIQIKFMKVLGGALAFSTTFGVVTRLRAPEALEPLNAQLVEVLSDPKTYGNIESVAKLLFNRYLLPFELTSILLLVAMIGAVIIAKRDPRSTFMPEGLKQELFRQRHGKSVHEGSTKATRVAPPTNAGDHH